MSGSDEDTPTDDNSNGHFVGTGLPAEYQ
jgi:hypothetical protein